MTSFSIKIEPRRSVFLKLVRDVQYFLNLALAEEHEKRGLTRAEIAKTLGKNKSVITRAFQNTGNLTLETLADIAFALDRVPNFNLLESRSINSEVLSRDKTINIPLNLEHSGSNYNIVTLNRRFLDQNFTASNKLVQLEKNHSQNGKMIVYLNQVKLNNAQLNASQVLVHDKVA